MRKQVETKFIANVSGDTVQELENEILNQARSLFGPEYELRIVPGYKVGQHVFYDPDPDPEDKISSKKQFAAQITVMARKRRRNARNR